MVSASATTAETRSARDTRHPASSRVGRSSVSASPWRRRNISTSRSSQRQRSPSTRDEPSPLATLHRKRLARLVDLHGQGGLARRVFAADYNEGPQLSHHSEHMLRNVRAARNIADVFRERLLFVANGRSRQGCPPAAISCKRSDTQDSSASAACLSGFTAVETATL